MSLPETKRRVLAFCRSIFLFSPRPWRAFLVFKYLFDVGVRGAQVAESSPAKQFLFKRSLQTAHRRRMLVEAEKPVGHALALQHRLLDKVLF